MTSYFTYNLRGQELRCKLVRGGVKNLNLRVQPDGSLRLSAPARVPKRALLDFLEEKADLILKMRGEILERAERHPLSVLLRDGMELSFWGERLLVRVRRKNGGKIELCAEGDTLYAAAPASFSPEQGEQALLEFYKRSTARRAEAFLPQVLEAMYGGRPPVPVRLRYRRMKSRWGSCRKSTGAITLNTRLAEYPPQALLGVLYHECAHLTHADHSERFYALLRAACPRYDCWMRLLND